MISWAKTWPVFHRSETVSVQLTQGLHLSLGCICIASTRVPGRNFCILFERVVPAASKSQIHAAPNPNPHPSYERHGAFNDWPGRTTYSTIYNFVLRGKVGRPMSCLVAYSVLAMVAKMRVPYRFLNVATYELESRYPRLSQHVGSRGLSCGNPNSGLDQRISTNSRLLSIRCSSREGGMSLSLCRASSLTTREFAHRIARGWEVGANHRFELPHSPRACGRP